MPPFVPSSEYGTVVYKGAQWLSLRKSAFEEFNVAVLGVGDVALPSKPIDAIATVFDLQGFTNFCKQIEPHLSVPHFLNAFLNWLFKQLRQEMRVTDEHEEVVLWSHLPFFVKYLGDGILALWDCKNMNDVTQRNVIVTAKQICQAYSEEFLPTLRAKLVEAPPILRCGIARGTVFSVGNGHDYVGSCINMAARLQKLPGITLCFNRRGFELEILEGGPRHAAFFRTKIAVREVSIRGIGDHELVCILRSEAEALSPQDKKTYRELM